MPQAQDVAQAHLLLQNPGSASQELGLQAGTTTRAGRGFFPSYFYSSILPMVLFVIFSLIFLPFYAWDGI